MSTTVAASGSLRVRHYFSAMRIALLALAGIALIAVAGMAIWFNWRLSAGLPQLDGSVRVPGLGAKVDVQRDARGVPHLRAQSLEDAVLAQGYVTAQDRLWQMDLSRRLAFGQLAEIFGGGLVEMDVEHRTLGLRQAAERSVEELSPAERRLLAAYARGVNVYIASHRQRLPVEFVLLGYQPRPWSQSDSVGVELNMLKTLNESWHEDLRRERILARVGPELYADLFPDHDPLDHPVAEPLGSRESKKTGSTSSLRGKHWLGMPGQPALDPGRGVIDQGTLPRGALLDATLAALLDPVRQKDIALGSNNWVVSGAHTKSGKPLLANDPHLGHSIPSVWYMIHLEAPSLDVSGVSLPGAPSVIIGHNQRIAWGFTNTGPDVQDLYLETFDPKHPDQYKVDGKWVRAEVRQETIKVRGGPDHQLTVRVTRHGPIVGRDGVYALALQWTALQPRALRFPMLAIDQAGNWQQFTAAIRDFTGPEQNMVYADVDGNIGYYAPAWVPIRKKGDGSVPVPGSTDDYGWTGYIPFEDLPHAYNPPGGIIATANSRVVPDGYPYFITHAWAAAWRTSRIFQLLESGRDFTVFDMLRIQMDIHSLEDEWLARRLVAAAGRHRPASAEAEDAVSLLGKWDGEARSDSAATLVAEVTRHALLRRLLAPKLGDETPAYVWALDMAFVENVLNGDLTRWLPPGDADFDETLMKSLEDGVKRIAAITGSSDAKAWKWGNTIPLTFHHPLGRLPLLGRLFDLGPFPQSGMNTTVKAATMGHGPSMRMVVDLADLDRSVNNITLGESGQVRSPYYKDQFDAWYHGRSFPMLFSHPAVEKGAVHRLTLEPQ